MSVKLPDVPPGKILLNKKWWDTPLGRDLLSTYKPHNIIGFKHYTKIFSDNHGGTKASIPDELVDFVPFQNMPVMLFDYETSSGSNIVLRIRKFKEVRQK
jgi:hypothetical protein